MSIISSVLVMVYIFMILFNPIYTYIPFGNYADELICLFLFGCAFIKFMASRHIIEENKNQIISIFCCIFVFFIGIISNVVYGYANSISLIIRDCVATFKFFITFYSARYLFKQYHSESLQKILLRIAKIFVIVIFLFSIVSLFVDIGMGDSVRYGIRSFKFIYSHYTYLVFNEAILLATIMCEEKKNIIYYIMSFITLFSTLRTKAFLFIAIVIAMSLIFYLKRNKKTINFKEIFKVQYIIPVVLVGFIIVRSKITEYLSWGINNSIRIGLHVIGLRIMSDYFPLGTGFGTFGTNISYAANSIVYNIYNTINYSALLKYGYATMSDVYWPAIYAQFGFFGFIAFLFALIMLIKDLLENKTLRVNVKKSLLCIMLFLVVSTSAEAVFSNEAGVFVALFMAIFMCFPLLPVDKDKLKN